MRRMILWRPLAVMALAVLLSAPGLQAEDGPSLDKEISFGVKMAQRGLWSEALFRFKRAAQLRPNDGKILNNLAVAYEAVGQYDSALEAYRQALQADSGNRELKRNYSRFIEFYQAFKPAEPESTAAEPAGIDGEEEAEKEADQPTEPPSSRSGQ